MKPETKIQRDVVALYRRIGCTVFILGAQPRRTMQTPGLPDLRVYHRGRRVAWWQEIKVDGGDLRPAQREFRELAEWCGDPMVVGGLTAALDFLRERGLAA